MFRKIFIHIGSHKTGTTSIQKALAQNIDALEKSKLYYYTKDKNGNEQYRFTLSSWFQKFSNGLANGFMIEDPEKLALSIANSSKNDIVVSAERFSFVFSKDQMNNFKKTLDKYFNEVKIIVYLRRQDKQILSQYNQSSKFFETPEHYFFGNTCTSLPTDKDYFRLYLDYYKKLSKWAEVFGKENIIIRIFDKKELINGDVVSDFFNLFGIDNFKQIEKVNESNGLEKTKVGLLMNQAKVPNNPLRNIINQNLNTKNKFLPKKEEAKKFYEQYRQSNIELNKMFNISEKNEAIFDEDFSMYPEEGNELWNEDNVNETIKTIFTNLNETYESINYNVLFQAALKLEKIDLKLSLEIMKMLNNIIPQDRNIRQKIEKYDILLKSFDKKKKVFCIGFHKTGTTSLKEALTHLGYKVTGPNGVRDENIEVNVLNMAYELVKHFDAFQDNPWPIIYKELDKKFPGSKFILTLRSPESWISSQIKHFGKDETPMRRWIYGTNAGCPQGNEEIYLERFNQHNKNVQEYFKDRPQDLLIMDLAKGDGWNKLCDFLGHKIPNIKFPHANKAGDRKKRINK